MLGSLLILPLKIALAVPALTVLWLSARRLLLSNTVNAWLYAAAAFFAVVSVLGLTPWIFGTGRSHPVFFLFGAMVPAVWYAVVTLCNATRAVRYDSELERTFLRMAALAKTVGKEAPLVLEGPEWPEAPQPVFRHASRPEIEPEMARPEPAPVRRIAADRTADKSLRLLDIARSMRGNLSSEARRIKLLPPPQSAAKRELLLLNPAE